jgi:nucleoid DNA-binding protein
MTRAQLVAGVATYLGHQGEPITKRRVESVLIATLEVIEEAMRERKRVDLRGFGTFFGRVRPAHEAVNPRNGERVLIAQRVDPKFRPSKMLRGRLNPVE